MKRFFFSAILLLLAGWSVAATTDEDGSRLWLRLDAVNTNAITGVKCTAMTELQTYWQGDPVVLKKQKGIAKDGYSIKSQGGKTVISAAFSYGSGSRISDQKSFAGDTVDKCLSACRAIESDVADNDVLLRLKAAFLIGIYDQLAAR